ncbi:MAG: hypothetical protein ACRBB0_16285 [Pelagimonas sp.]|uniref:hypothetical protein n=1 Tax=Pelagimonas sp. TaxID=2073170 RepID=UPI003D6B9D34
MRTPQAPLAKAQLFGSFEIRAMDGRDLTPRKSAKAQGLLGLLLLAPDMSRSKEYLIDKLWSDRQPVQGGRSLKNEIYTIRRHFGDLRDLIRTEHNTVSLKPGAFLRDLDAPDFKPADGAALLESSSIRDPEFVEWLETERSNAAKLSQRRPAPILYIDSARESALFHNDAVTNAFGQTLADWCAIRIVSANEEDPDFNIDQETASGFWLRSSAANGASQVATNLQMSRSSDKRLLWNRSELLPVDPTDLLQTPQMHRLVNTSVDRTVFNPASPDRKSPELRYLERGTLGAIRLIFRNQNKDLELARHQLAVNHEAEPSGIFLAWSAYILAFFKGERLVAQEALRDEAEDLASRALELDPYNSMVLALTSYIYTYLLDNPAYGLELSARAIEANRSNPLAWSFRSAALYTLGQLPEAMTAANFARSISGDGPYRYAVETFYCIAAAKSHHIDEAIRAGEASFRLKPDFRAPLRYLTLLYAYKGETKKLDRLVTHMRQDEPDYSLSKLIHNNNYPSEILRSTRVANELIAADGG